MRIVVRDESEDWLKTIIEEFESIEAKTPEVMFLGAEDWPKWVQALAREYVKTTLPTYKWKSGKTWTPAEVATVTAYRLLYLELLCEPNPALEKALEKLPPEVVSYLEKLGKPMVEQIPDFIEASMAAVSLALLQPHDEAKQFFKAFAKAYSRPPSDLGATNFLRTSTRVQFAMLMGWKQIAKLDSVRELHAWLCARMEPHLVGDQKRIEKLCERIELTFRKRGRPSKSASKKSKL